MTNYKFPQNEPTYTLSMSIKDFQHVLNLYSTVNCLFEGGLVVTNANSVDVHGLTASRVQQISELCLKRFELDKHA